MGKISHYLLVSLCCYSSSFAAPPPVTNTPTLEAALKEVNASGGVVTFNDSVTLTDQVRAVNADKGFGYAAKTITINGNSHTIDGDQKNNRGFFVGGSGATLPFSGKVTISDLIFDKCQAIGGDGAGGGMGAGGGLFVGQNTQVVLNNCSFNSCGAEGGSGSTSTPDKAVGGGGMRGAGGSTLKGGGGFGGDALDAGGGASGFIAGNALNSSTPGGNFDGERTVAAGLDADPGIGGVVLDPGFLEGQNGGHGGGAGTGQFGGNGGFGGGGGGTALPTLEEAALIDTFGMGGFGGGGGNGTGLGQNNGGAGFGAGGGMFNGNNGFGGGNGLSDTGGKGAGFGGAIFIQDGAELTISGTFSLSDNFAAAGKSGTTNQDPNAGFGTLGQDIFMMSTSTIIFDTINSVLLQNPIQGNQGNEFPGPMALTSLGGLTKKGGQTLGLSGDNTYTGVTTVEGGTLQVNGSLVSNVVVEAPGILLGNFDLKKDATGANGGDLTNKGVFIASPQTDIAGLYTNESGIFQVDITPTGVIADKTYVIGNADITGGDLQIFVGEGNYISGTQYTLITGNVMGAFANQADPTLIGPNAENVKVEVTTGSLILTITEDNFFPIILPINPDNPNNPTIPILTQQVALCLQASAPPPGSDLALVIESLGTLSLNQRIKALQTLSARNYGSLEWINERNNSYSAELLTHHLSELYWDCDCNYNGWATVFGNLMNNQKEQGNLPRYNADSAGVLTGVDFSYNACFTTGLAFGYTRTHVLWRNDGGGGNTDSYYGALYGDYESECFGLDFSALGGGTFNDMRRHIDFANIDRNARSDYWSYFVTGHLQIEPYRFTTYADNCIVHFEPFAVADYHYYTHGTFTEKGANSLNLRVKSKNQHFMRGEAGVKWSYEKCCDCYTYSPYIGASWVGEFPLGKSRQPSSFIGQSCVINALSYKSDVHLGSGQVGIRFAHCNGASFQLGYKGLFNNHVRINEVEGRFEWIF